MLLGCSFGAAHGLHRVSHLRDIAMSLLSWLRCSVDMTSDSGHSLEVRHVRGEEDVTQNDNKNNICHKFLHFFCLFSDFLSGLHPYSIEPPLGVIPEQGASPILHKGARCKP